MTLHGEPRVWMEQFPPGQAVPFTIDHLGLQYSGEVIRSGRWSDSWSQPLTEDVYFRIVLLGRRNARLGPNIQDPRVAVCQPAPGLTRLRTRLSGELATTRETQALYLGQRHPEADLISNTMRQHQEELETQYLGEESVRYSEGQILTGAGQHPDPASIFAGLEPVAWFSRLAGWLLASAYPDLPIDASDFPHPIAIGDVAKLHAALFGHPGGSADTLSRFGPGLGLASSGAPLPTNLASCPVAGLIRDQLSSQPTPVKWGELHHYLAHQTGLTGPLATLYLVLYLTGESPPLEIQLTPDHQLTMVDGRPLPGGRLTGDLVPSCLWDQRIGQWATSIGPESEPLWNDALPYFWALSPGLTAIAEGEEYAAQERVLLEAVISLREELDLAQGFLALVNQDAPLADTTAYANPLSRLAEVSGGDLAAVYRSLRNLYTDYRELQTDLAGLHHLAQLNQSKEDILGAREYLDRAAVPEDLPDLSILRQSLRAALSTGPLLQSSRGWDSMVTQVSRFKSDYAAVYRRHHQVVHQGLPSYQLELDGAKRKMGAQGLLNTLAELGAPTGDDLSQPLESLDRGPDFCSASPPDLDLETVPVCPRCSLSLEWSIPSQELARLGASIESVLGEKNRRLSNLLVERILHGNTDQRLDDFLAMVQASDLSALSNTLNGELLDFLRNLLA
ncbi:MAG: hypothetical protein IIB29_03840 [Chloroflexi bacterium]|nr:hypothetical protein [Chloroflexota bacterium]